MKKLFYLLVIFCFSANFTYALPTELEHPIDVAESNCKAEAKTVDEWSRCSLKAANAWNREVDKYYSLLYKKLTGDSKTALFEDQKYWVMYKNNEFKVIDALYNKDNETKERALFRSNQKRDLIKSRANNLRIYYIQTFPDDEQEKIEINNNSNFKLDPMLQRGLRWLGF